MSEKKLTVDDIEKMILDWIRSDNENTTYIAHQIHCAVNNIDFDYSFCIDPHEKAYRGCGKCKHLEMCKPEPVKPKQS